MKGKYYKSLYNFMNAISGKFFVKKHSLKGKSLYIEYFSSFDEFLKRNPNSTITSEIYESYFDSGNKIEKLLLIESVRILREFKEISIVKMSLTFEGVEYRLSIHIDYLNEFLERDIRKLEAFDSDNSWINHFFNKYGSGLDNKHRKGLFNFFTTKKIIEW